jgi:hypothetical protein
MIGSWMSPREKHLGERVANQFADAQLTLRAAHGLITLLTVTGHLF